jgi:CP family cyanate transporter-like MFS transporter
VAARSDGRARAAGERYVEVVAAELPGLVKPIVAADRTARQDPHVAASGPPHRAPAPRLAGPALPSALLALALVLLGVNLRATMASLPPLLDEVERDLELTGAGAGLLTALPVLCMGAFAPPAHRLAHRFGREATATGALALIAIGTALRLGGASGAVFGGTFVAGVGIAICGVVLPGIVKEFFPARAGAATGAYLVALAVGASLAAALAVPIARALGSWEASLAAWCLPALVALGVWLPITRRLNQREPREEAARGGLPWRTRPAWLLVALLALQGALFYGYLAWLAPAYEARGWSAAATGALSGAFLLAQLGAVFALPAVTDRSADRRAGLLGAVGATTVGSVWLAAGPDALPWIPVALVGFGLGGGFSLGVVLLVDYAADPPASSRLSAMVFLASYPVGAATPIFIGALRDATGGFAVAFAALAAAAVAQLGVAARLGPWHRGAVE